MRSSLDPLFVPSSVAVIGASSRPGSIGREILHNILMAEFNGKVFPVNPKASVLHSIKSYSTILDVPDAVDMAIVVVPKDAVSGVIRQCGEKGVKAVVVITAGFSEVGEKGKELEHEALAIAEHHGMRMVGPNCFGVVNTHPDVRLNATFGKVFPRHGRIGFITQSGAMGEAIMNHANDVGIGFSIVASLGNKADISGNDVLQYLESDPNTDVILLYLESFGNPRKFTVIARDVSRNKPIIAVKSGRTRAGARAATSHTGALAGIDVGVDALFDQTGVMRVDTVGELFDVAATLASQPVPRGNRVVVVTNAGGPGVLATDALVSEGLEVPPLSESTIETLRTEISPEASFSNPLDMVAGAGAREFRVTLEALRDDERYDCVLPILVPPKTLDQLEVAKNIRDALEGTSKTVIACLMGAGKDSVGVEFLRNHGIPVSIYPESAAKTLHTILRYRSWLDRPRGTMRTFDVEKDAVRGQIDEARASGSKSIIGQPAIKILEAYGIQAEAYSYATSEDEAVERARAIGLPVVMKIDSPKMLHKTEKGGVIVDLHRDDDVREAFRELGKRARRHGEEENRDAEFRVALQRMVQGGVETVMGMSYDPSFGPLLMFGLGGIYVEIMKDVSFKIHPLSDAGADEMIRALRSYPLLTGFRGSPSVDLEYLREALLRLSQLVADFDEFEEIDVNPFMASSERSECVAVDARFVLRDEDATPS